MVTSTAGCGAVREVDARALRDELAGGQVELIDVREPDEHAAERIQGARLLPLARIDGAAVGSLLCRRVVFHCRSGRRSAEAAARAMELGVQEARSLRGGIEAWKAAGLPVQRAERMPISVLRQTQLVIGSIVLAGVALATTVSAWFLILPAAMGIGLVVAGTTGTCGLATALDHAPWNRRFRPASDADDARPKSH